MTIANTLSTVRTLSNQHGQNKVAIAMI